jgi:hypothetical protein
MRPFWLVTRHADVTAVEAKGAPFIATPRSVLSSEDGEANMQQISGKPDVLRTEAFPSHAMFSFWSR